MEITAHASPLPVVRAIFERQQFHGAADLDGYLKLLQQLKVLIIQTRELTEGQAKRGIVLPKPESLLRKRSFLHSSRNQRRARFPLRRKGWPPSILPLSASVSRKGQGQLTVESEINPALQALVDYVGGKYAKKAPEKVGLGQYPGGGRNYYNSSSILTPPWICRRKRFISSVLRPVTA